MDTEGAAPLLQPRQDGQALRARPGARTLGGPACPGSFSPGSEFCTDWGPGT